MEPAGIYVHIPFCASKCHYCDFNSYALGQARTEPYLDSLHQEIVETLHSIGDGARFGTVYFGGGTPTICSAEQLVSILDAIRSGTNLAPDAEITVEANPGTVSPEKLAGLREGGFRRISFGVQAFDNSLLRSIGRIHTCEQALEGIEMARAAGFDNINADLMFGLPGQTVAAFRDSLAQILNLDTPHLSIYGLIVEEGTAFGRWREEGRLDLPGEDAEREMYDAVIESTEAAGYRQYEVSNFARSGFECRHNRLYWRNGPYLGFGAGAVAFWNGVRRTNCLLPGDYVRRMREGVPLAVTEERLGPMESLGETLMLGLRTVDGVDLDDAAGRHGIDPRNLHARHIDRMTARGWLVVEGSRMRLTREGFPFANEVWAGFLA